MDPVDPAIFSARQVQLGETLWRKLLTHCPLGGGRGWERRHILVRVTPRGDEAEHWTRIDATAALAKANVRLESEILRTALLGTASHELRSPIAAILGKASVLDRMLVLQGDEHVRSLMDGMSRVWCGPIQPISSLPRSGSARIASPPIG
jgi:signal transduction histidine kinase